jgi:hypothetical protein
LKHAGFSPAPDATPFVFKETWELLGFPDIWNFEKRWARD